MTSALKESTTPKDSARSSGRKSLSAILDNPHFPSPPALALQIVDKASQPDCDPADILELLKRDPGLCGRVFKMVNSSVFGLGRPIATLERAVLVLGLKPLRSLVLGMSLPAVQSSRPDSLVGEYWREAVSGAVIARAFALHLRRPEPDDDFLAGLLRDLGVAVLQQIFADEYHALWEHRKSLPLPEQCQLETEKFGINHAETSAAIMESWRMPPEVVIPIRFHHDPSTMANATKAISDRAWLLSFASRAAKLEAGDLDELDALLRVARDRFNLAPEAVAKVLEDVIPKIHDLAQILQVNIGACPDLAAIVATGCEELVKLSVETSRKELSVSSQTPLPSLMATNLQTHPSRPPSGSASREQPSTIHEFDLECLDKMPAEGTVLDGYEIKGTIGQGAMGVVFRAFEPSLQRVVAIKMLKPERLVSSDARIRFQREARASAAIQHPNVMTIFAVREFKGLPYIVMEYLEGYSLQDRIDEGRPIPIEEIVGYAHQLAQGLQAAHAKKVIHRDIKPDNLVVDRASGVMKITDFGLARVQDNANVSQAGYLVGTPLYMSPEQFAGGEIDHRADLFAFGNVLYALCTGSPPFASDSLITLMNKVAKTRPIALKVLRPDLPMWLDEIIGRLQAKTPMARYASAGDVLRAIETHAKVAAPKRMN